MFKDLNDVRLLAAVVRRGGITRGADELRMPTATASRRLAALEREVGARLIERSSRRFVLTEAGQAYAVAAQRLVEELDAAAASLSRMDTRPSGHLRIAAPPDFAASFLAGPIASFCRLYPDITLDLDLSPRRVDLIDEGFDVAIRMGALEDARWVSRPLLRLRRSLFASRTHLRRAGTPAAAENVAECRMVVLAAYRAYGDLVLHRADRPSVTRTIAPRQYITVNSMPMLRQLVLAGAGIGLVPDVLLAQEERAGKVERVLPEWNASAVDAHLLYRSREFLPRRVRLLVDHLIAEIAGE